ncbi:hypothetical protein H2199_005823 [Coniosporium tulheliwenetii]|uniref:Uncharacterized protein n=1 Tax=Coniosporium tulheliwenetii TaxID=3383036 RepID=A0ACC2YY99_9PEZI|nr:hypothetical protein H2199_005823 [Cladosporium sp. JES 115]
MQALPVRSGGSDSMIQAVADSQDGFEDGMDEFVIDENVPAATQELFDPDEVVPSDPLDRTYLKALKGGYVSLSQVIWKEEREIRRSALENVDPLHWEDISVNILASIPMSLLNELVSGNIARENQSGQGSVWETLRYYLTRASQQPSIYVHVFADENGESPSCHALNEMVRYLQTYAAKDAKEHSQLAYNIDRVKHPTWSKRTSEKGGRYYLATGSQGSTPYAPSSVRTSKLLTFCESLKRRIDQVPKSKWHLPLLGHPLSEVGYAKNAASRLQQHRNHASSNWLMCLIEALSEAQFQRRYWMHQYVVYYIWHPTQAIIGEVLFSKICRSYIEDGAFNYEGAGGSNRSILTIIEEKVWDKFEENVAVKPLYKENIKHEHERLQKAYEQRERLRSELTALESEEAKLQAELDAHKEAERLVYFWLQAESLERRLRRWIV